MGRFIHISTRRNLIYVIHLMIYYYLRKIDSIILNTKFKFKDSLIFAILMFLGEFFGGLSIFIYQSLVSKQRNRKGYHFGIKLIGNIFKLNRRDGYFKIVILIFFAAFFNFMQFIIASFYIPKFNIVSTTATYRFGGIIIIIGALLCYFNLRIKILKHQFYSLIIIIICSILMIIFEFIFKKNGVLIKDFSLAYFFVICNLIFVAFTDIIEKYLLEFDFMDPFLTLLIESIFGFIFIAIFSFGNNPFEDVIRLFVENDVGNFIFLIILLVLYFVFSAGTNVYKILVNGLYSPMVKTLAVYILNPFLFIYYFVTETDFMTGNNRNYFYFIISIILALIISFFGCVFNEVIVLFCCGLAHETHSSIKKRATEDVEERNFSSYNERDVSLDEVIVSNINDPDLTLNEFDDEE